MSDDDGNTLHSGTIAKGTKARDVIVVDAPTGLLSLEYSEDFGAVAIRAVPG